MYSRTLLYFLPFLVVALVACSVLVDADDRQCSTDDACSAKHTGVAGLECVDGVCVAAEGADSDAAPDVVVPDAGADATSSAPDAEPPGVWECVGRHPPPVLSDVVSVTVPIRTLTMAALPDVRVKTCSMIDVSCEDPVLEEVVTNEQGEVVLDLPADFQGYLEATHPDYVPLLVQLSTLGAVYHDPDHAVWTSPQLLTSSNYDTILLLTRVSDIQIEPDRGQVHVLIEPCRGSTPYGVRLELADLEEGTTPFYLEDGLPALSAEYTDADGLAGFLNAAPGIRSLTAHQASDGMLVGRSTFLVRAGWSSAVAVLPLFEGESP